MAYFGRTLSRLTLAASLAAAALARETARAGETESDTLFEQGRDLRKAGKCDEAILKFRKALETFPEGLGALRNIAECEVQLGKFASARRDYADLKIAVLQSNQPKYLNPANGARGWDKDAEEGRSALENRVAKVTIVVTGDRPESMTLTVNGKPFDPGLIGVELEQDDGPFLVELRYGASAPLTRTVEIKEGARERIELVVPAGAAAAAAAAAKQQRARETPPPSSGAGSRIGGGVAVGVAGLAAIGTGIAVAIRQGALSTVTKDCPLAAGSSSHRICDTSVYPNIRSDYGRAQTANSLMIVAAVTTGVGLAVGVPLLVLAPKGAGAGDADKPATGEPPRASLRIDVVPAVGGGGVGVRGEF